MSRRRRKTSSVRAMVAWSSPKPMYSAKVHNWTEILLTGTPRPEQSGGAAVALSCGMVPVASGSDSGGSLRNPAAWCNIVGFRPSIGHVPNPTDHFGWSTLWTNGCLGRSSADLALALSTIAGPDKSAPLSINEPGSLFARPLERSFKGVRVAWFKDLNGIPIDPRVSECGDQGDPIVHKYPDSSVAKEYQTLAATVIEQLNRADKGPELPEVQL